MVLICRINGKKHESRHSKAQNMHIAPNWLSGVGQ